MGGSSPVSNTSMFQLLDDGACARPTILSADRAVERITAAKSIDIDIDHVKETYFILFFESINNDNAMLLLLAICRTRPSVQ